MQYAIVDIETTGGSARGSRMTEIAIVVHDGERVIDRWESLINPEQMIPPAIFALTGITNEMVAGAPVFADLAERIFRMLDGRVFVAHNVNFDYSFVKQQLEEAGFRWSARKLCTVRMARKIRPGLPSYSLGRLCDVLAIPLSNRHRAGGDADATTILFERMLEWDEEGVVEAMLRKSSPDQRLPPNLQKEDFDALPGLPGVYYFYNRSGKAIYVGKAVNLKKRVASHFTGHNINLRRQQFLREIFHISFEVCATELMALLLECAEIKRLWPAYNRALKRFEPKFGLFSYRGMDGYDYLAVGRIARQQQCIQVFQREYDAVRTLRQLCQSHDLDLRFCRFGQARISAVSSVPSVPPQPGMLQDSAREKDSTRNNDSVTYNNKVEKALTAFQESQPSFYMLDRGRAGYEEQSCILVDRGRFYGMGYIAADQQISNPQELRECVQRYPDNHYMMELINQFASKYPHKVFSISTRILQ